MNLAASRQLLVCFLLSLHLAFYCCFCRSRPLGSGVSYDQSSSCQPLLFVFGASMADTGEFSSAMPYYTNADYPPYGVDHFSGPAGRWSNGRVFTDFISQELGYGLLHPYLNSVFANFTFGANFASAGSTARDDNSHMFPLSVQVDQFKKLLAELLDSSSLTRARYELRQGYSQQQIAEAIYLFEAANNDYVYQFENTTDFDALELVADVLSAMETALTDLYSLGGRNFLIMTLTPLGCSPDYLTTFPSFDIDDYGCKSFFNSIAKLHNLHLEELLSNLTAEFPDANWILFDAYSLFWDAYHTPSKYGIRYPFKACCGAGGEYNYVEGILCGDSGYVNGTFVEATRCEDPSLYLIWDSIHPVESFCKYIADGVITGSHLRPAFNITNTCSSLA